LWCSHRCMGPLDSRRKLYETKKLVQRTRECWAEAEMFRLGGKFFDEPAHSGGEPTPPSTCVSGATSTKFWELRATMSMAWLWRAQGEREEARHLLAPVYGWFTEEFDTRDLKEAQALLNELSS